MTCDQREYFDLGGRFYPFACDTCTPPFELGFEIPGCPAGCFPPCPNVVEVMGESLNLPTSPTAYLGDTQSIVSAPEETGHKA